MKHLLVNYLKCNDINFNLYIIVYKLCFLVMVVFFLYVGLIPRKKEKIFKRNVYIIAFSYCQKRSIKRGISFHFGNN